MITFKQYCESSKAPGNYVAIDATDPNGFVLPDELRPKSGTEVKLEKRHVTLIYSKNSNIDCDKILRTLKSEFPKNVKADIVGFDCFDAIPKDGERDAEKATLVMKLKSHTLDEIHSRLIELGCKHSYDKFSAHISLFYGVDRDECHQLVKKLADKIELPIRIDLNGYTSEPIDEDWHNKLD